MTEAERRRFDALVAEAVGALPAELIELLESCPLVVLDGPDAAMLADLGLSDDPAAADELCGLHSGLSDVERGVETSGEPPNQIHLFRRGIVGHAGGWAAGEDAVYEEIAVTLLHEIGHQFGLDEDDLERLGYD